MRSIIIKPVVFAVATAVTFVASVVFAQETGRVAILDVAKVFKENPVFDAKPLPLNADAFKAKVTAEHNRIKAEVMKLRGMEASPDRNQMEADLEQRHTRLRTTTQQNLAELLNREARAYYDTYREMQVIVEALVKEYGLLLVLYVDNEKAPPNNPNEVIRTLARPVVFHPQLDLTKLVSERLKARMSAAASAPITQ